jgi:hypothetical protein
MKAMKLMSMVAAAAVSMVMMTSCLSDTNDNFNGSAYAVGRTTTSGAKLLDVYTSYYGILPLYSESSAKWAEAGGCYLVDYDVNTGDSKNSDYSSNGYYVATISKTSDIDKGNSVLTQSDTTKVLTNELPITNATGLAYVDYYLFIASSINEPAKQQNLFTLYGTTSQSLSTDSNGPYFDLFLRVVKQVDASGTATSTEEDRAFDIKTWITTFSSVAKAAGKSSYKIKINYPSSISSKDSTVTWSSFYMTVPVA